MFDFSLNQKFGMTCGAIIGATISRSDTKFKFMSLANFRNYNVKNGLFKFITAVTVGSVCGLLLTSIK